MAICMFILDTCIDDLFLWITNTLQFIEHQSRPSYPHVGRFHWDNKMHLQNL